MTLDGVGERAEGLQGGLRGRCGDGARGFRGTGGAGFGAGGRRADAGLRGAGVRSPAHRVRERHAEREGRGSAGFFRRGGTAASVVRRTVSRDRELARRWGGTILAQRRDAAALFTLFLVVVDVFVGSVVVAARSIRRLAFAWTFGRRCGATSGARGAARRTAVVFGLLRGFGLRLRRCLRRALGFGLRRRFTARAARRSASARTRGGRGLRRLRGRARFSGARGFVALRTSARTGSPAPAPPSPPAFFTEAIARDSLPASAGFEAGVGRGAAGREADVGVVRAASFFPSASGGVEVGTSRPPSGGSHASNAENATAPAQRVHGNGSSGVSRSRATCARRRASPSSTAKARKPSVSSANSTAVDARSCEPARASRARAAP